LGEFLLVCFNAKALHKGFLKERGKKQYMNEETLSKHMLGKGMSEPGRHRGGFNFFRPLSSAGKKNEIEGSWLLARTKKDVFRLALMLD